MSKQLQPHPLEDDLRLHISCWHAIKAKLLPTRSSYASGQTCGNNQKQHQHQHWHQELHQHDQHGPRNTTIQIATYCDAAFSSMGTSLARSSAVTCTEHTSARTCTEHHEVSSHLEHKLGHIKPHSTHDHGSSTCNNANSDAADLPPSPLVGQSDAHRTLVPAVHIDCTPRLSTPTRVAAPAPAVAAPGSVELLLAPAAATTRASTGPLLRDQLGAGQAQHPGTNAGSTCTDPASCEVEYLVTMTEAAEHVHSSPAGDVSGRTASCPEHAGLDVSAASDIAGPAASVSSDLEISTASWTKQQPEHNGQIVRSAGCTPCVPESIREARRLRLQNSFGMRQLNKILMQVPGKEETCEETCGPLVQVSPIWT